MAEWRKAIPESRDRLQSKVLVWCVVPVLICPLPLLGLMAWGSPRTGIYSLEALGVSLTFAILVWVLRAATPAAALCGSLICLLATVGTGRFDQLTIHSGLAPLTALFILTFLATRAGRRRKTQLGLAEGKRGRNAAQIIANLGASGLVVVGGIFGSFDFLCCRGVSGLFGFSVYALPVGLLAALCEATADTVSSEIGQGFGGEPIMLTTLRRVAAGTDGAVTVLGTTAGIIAAGIVAGVGRWAMRMDWRQALSALAGGIAGLFFDSVLGATLERKGWLGNDLVNFSSTVFAVAVALGLTILFY